MSFAPPFAILKRIDPHTNVANTFAVSASSAVQYCLNGLFVACQFKGNADSLAVAFLMTGLFSAVLNMVTVEFARRQEWRKESLKFALTTEDFICDAGLLSTIATMKSLEIAKEGLYTGAALAALGSSFVAWDGYWARQGCKTTSPLSRNPEIREGKGEMVDEMVDDCIEERV
jgi:hypothetical protein